MTAFGLRKGGEDLQGQLPSHQGDPVTHGGQGTPQMDVSIQAPIPEHTADLTAVMHWNGAPIEALCRGQIDLTMETDQNIRVDEAAQTAEQQAPMQDRQALIELE